MKFGLFGGAVIKNDADSGDSIGYQPFFDLILEAEELGFENMFMVEHHFGGDGQISASLNLLSYLAAKTTTLRLGTAVTVLPWHNPVLLAEQVATLDVLSKGRVDFGVGKGYRENEYKGFCIPKEEAFDRYQESLDILKQSWTSAERFNFKGNFWQYNDILVEPSPVQKPHPPLWSAAGSNESIQAVAGAGFNVLFDHFANFERTQQRIDIWKQECDKTGRDFNPHEVVLARGLTITSSNREYEEAMEKREKRVSKMIAKYGALPGIKSERPNSYSDKGPDIDDAALIGEPEVIIKRLKILENMGFKHINILLPDERESLQVFSEQVMPEFKESANISQSSSTTVLDQNITT